MNDAQIDNIMTLVQEFASAWSLLGSTFGNTTLEDAEAAKERVRTALREALVRPEDIGGFVDHVNDRFPHIERRTPAAVAARLIEEATELGLSTGMDAGKILAVVADSLHNQALKASRHAGYTFFPSELHLTADTSTDEQGDEAADVNLCLQDFAHVSRINLNARTRLKFEAMQQKHLYIGPNGTIRAVKPHVVGAA